MYPRLTGRRTEEDKPAFCYVCRMKTRSRRDRCDSINLNGNSVDQMLMEQIRRLQEDPKEFRTRLEDSRKFCGDREKNCPARLSALRETCAKNEKTITGLVDALAMAQTKEIKERMLRRISQLSDENDNLMDRIRSLETSDGEGIGEEQTQRLLRLWGTFDSAVEGMELEGKRELVRTLVRKVFWDGENIHVILHGTEGAENSGEIQTRSERKYRGEDSK